MRALLLTVGKALTLSGPLTPVPLGDAASITLTAVGGTPPYRITRVSDDFPAEWTIPDSSVDDVTLSTGETLVAGTYTVTFRVKDNDRNSRLVTRTLQVIALPLEIAFTSLPDGTEGVAYSGQATAQYGTAPYTYSKIAGPSWLSVNPSTGALTGTPDADGTGITVTVRVTDDASNTEDATGTIDIAAAPTFVSYNPADKTAEITLSNGNLTCTGSGSVWRGVRTTGPKSSGKWFKRFRVDEIHTVGFTSSAITGVATASYGLSNYVGSDTQSWGIQAKGSSTQLTTWHNGSNNTHGTGVDVGGYLLLAVDIDAGKLWMGPVGGYVGGGDPATGTSPTFTFTPGTTLYLATSCFDDKMDTTLDSTGTSPSGFAEWIE